ncbi:ubiquitin carboxyl-terminal hydrolase-domain-containing protein [Mycena floridula]|nr:ubiquitin carboxyl-terminal hydrolase-domain-containing protein [Mycena floridula]
MARYSQLPSIALGYLEPVTSLSFDPSSDVLWVGSNSGYVTSYCRPPDRPEIGSGVSFRVGNHAVQKIASGESFVRATTVSGDGIGSWAKGGMNKWFYRSPGSLTTFSSPSNSSHAIAAASITPDILFLNAMTGTIVREIPTPSLVTHLEFSPSFLISGAADGIIRTHDPRTGASTRSEGTVKAHVSGIQALQTTGNFVCTIGLSMRQGRPFPDPLVKVYDLRNMRALPPIPFSSGPAFINVVPQRSSTIAIGSSQGLINIVDVINPSAPNEFYQLDLTSYLTSFAVSPGASYLAAGDAEGRVHLSCRAAEEEALPPLNGFAGLPAEWADHPAPLPDIQWTDSTPLSSIGMPHYKTKLLSSWSANFIATPLYYPPPAKIPPQILNNIKINDTVSYANLPKELRGRRNMVTAVPAKRQGRFRSGKARRSESEPETPIDHTPEDVPKMYRHVEIEYSKFGVEDFDFGFYNKTNYSGLETHILNCYTNSIIQVLHYSTPVRTLAKSHIKTDCLREHCLLCELGFLARMLEDAEGKNCQASNFCKTVGVLAQAANVIDLIDYGQDSSELDYTRMIQSFHRFLLDSMSVEGNTYPANPLVVCKPDLVSNSTLSIPSPITQLMGIDAKNISTCMNCKAAKEKDNMTHIVELNYPRKVPSDPVPMSDFASIVQSSLIRHMTHKAICHSCKQLTTVSLRRSIPTKDLPPILALNAAVFNDEDAKFWLDTKFGTFLKPVIDIRGQVAGVDDPNIAVYQLRAVIVNIEGRDRAHLAAIVKGKSYFLDQSRLLTCSIVPEAEGDASPWYLFNDFQVRNVTEEEALSFPGRWKVPTVLHFERVDTRHYLDFRSLPTTGDYSILTRDTSISENRDSSRIKHECLSMDERPTPGTMVSIDAEFVSMQQEESEYRSDGSHRVLRPARLSLARVSVLRGSGPKKGLPFIDDHIHTSEVIVDYLTEFSGIRFGDLDPAQSPYTLTPLKVVYKKLRLLVDSGCTFIGHGLAKDFRIINIFIPPDRVIDTVDVYWRPERQRRISLRFLAWFILHEHIQTETHDSIEDARCALELYHASLEFQSEGTFDRKIDELYKAGKQHNFKPPQQQTSPDPVNAVVASYTTDNMLLEARMARMYPSSHSSTPVPTPPANNFGQPVITSHRGDKSVRIPGYIRGSGRR